MDRGTDVCLAGPVSPAEQRPRANGAVSGGVHQVGHDPIDAQPAATKKCRSQVPVPTCGVTLTYGTVTNPRLVDELETFYQKIVTKIKNWYTEESKNLSVEISTKKTEAFFGN